jgi:hypothetical protein
MLSLSGRDIDKTKLSYLLIRKNNLRYGVASFLSLVFFGVLEHASINSDVRKFLAKLSP